VIYPMQLNKTEHILKLMLAALTVIALTGCPSNPIVSNTNEDAAEGEQIVALVGPDDAPWMDNVETSLGALGFRSRRYLAGREYDMARRDGVRYALYVQGSYSLRCMPGGFMFTDYSASLVNLSSGRVISSLKTSGLSEGCVPAGSVFSATANLVNRNWSLGTTVRKVQVEPVQPVSAVNPIPPSFEDAKSKCIDLGFKQGTEGFGRCVLRLTK
jgi:hypothetical protein